MRLAADLPRLWDNPATSQKDRKRLLRTVISDVTILSTQDSGQICIGVRWHTGATEQITTSRRSPTAHRPALSSWPAVWATSCPTKNWPRPLQDPRTPHPVPAPCEITIKQAAARLCIKPDAIYNWIWLGHVPARKDPTGRWCIPWTPEVEKAYQQRVTESAHLKPSTPLIPAGGAL